MPDAFTKARFATSVHRSDFFVQQLARVYRGAPNFSLLDIGSGTGGHLFAIARQFPEATLHGVDISPQNVNEAARIGQSLSAKISFECGDFMTRTASPVDIVILDSTLHLISGETASLVKLLGQTVKSGGLLLFSMPVTCWRNRLLISARHILRLIRCRLLDWAMLSLAKVIYKKSSIDENALSERIQYMYIIPHRMYDQGLKTLLRENGLTMVSETLERQQYLLKPKHIFAIWKRDASPSPL